MNHLDRELRRLEDLHAPDLRSRIGGIPYGERRVDDPSNEGRIAAVVVAAFVAIAGIGFGVLALEPVDEVGVRPHSGESAEASTYEFSDVVAGPSKAEPEDLAVTFTVSWSTDTYPGVHFCRYIAYRADGSVLGETAHYSDWQPGRWSHDVPGDPERATSGAVLCEAERLDVPGIADVEPIARDGDTTMGELSDERAERLADWVATFQVGQMSDEALAGNLWAVRGAVSQKPIHDLTIFWQLSDRMRYLCVRLPIDHEFRGGEFCD